MERKKLTEELKDRYALYFIEDHILGLCSRCAEHSSLDKTTANELLEALLQREQLLEEGKI